MAVRVAVDADDRARAERVSQLISADDSPFAAMYPHIVHWGRSVLDGDLKAAADSAANAADSALMLTDRAEALTELAATLVADGRCDDAAAAVQRLDDILATITEPAPLMRARASVVRARLGLAASRLGSADQAAHDALRTAGDAGLRLVHIDALEAVAAVAVAAEELAKAARLAAAVDAERGRCGYRGRLTSPVPQALIDQLAVDEPTAWTEGAALTLEQATALAQRSRGPRGRPSFGLGALTPTERLVVQHVAHGMTNAEIAAHLLIAVPTVKTHFRRIFTKVGVRNRAELASLATQAVRG